jgi:hypothetical protein
MAVFSQTKEKKYHHKQTHSAQPKPAKKIVILSEAERSEAQSKDLPGKNFQSSKRTAPSREPVKKRLSS